MRDLRSMRCIPLLCAVLAVSLVYTVDLESCNTPPCEATCAIVCSTPATTVKIDEINDFDVSLDVNISAAVDIDCGTANEIVIALHSAWPVAAGEAYLAARDKLFALISEELKLRNE